MDPVWLPPYKSSIFLLLIRDFNVVELKLATFECFNYLFFLFMYWILFFLFFRFLKGIYSCFKQASVFLANISQIKLESIHRLIQPDPKLTFQLSLCILLIFREQVLQIHIFFDSEVVNSIS